MDKNEKFDDIFGTGKGMPNGGLPPELQRAVALMIVGGGSLPGMMPGNIITGDEVETSADGKLHIPAGWSFERTMKVLRQLHDDAETETDFTREFKYRKDDGAVATSRVLSRRFGMPLGKKLDMGFFGSMPARSLTVQISHNETIQVPWGSITLPALPDIEFMMCNGHSHDEYGQIFCLHITAPKKHKDLIESILSDIEEELRTNSIYRGKALVGSDKLEFLDLSGFDETEIVFSDQAEAELMAGVYALLEHTAAFVAEGMKTKRTALLHGPYGTGKSSCGLITAKIATANGWTFLSARPGVDDIEDVLKTAKLYEPCVVFVEDIDTQTSTSDDDEVSKLLDAFDGIAAKGGKLLVVMTTNHLDRIHKGMLRPGRLDTIIEIGCLDRGGVERLTRRIVPAHKLAADVDFDAVYESMTGFFPAFVREALERAKTFAISRAKGGISYVLTTEDLVAAAKSLHPQLEALNKAEEGERPPVLETLFRGLVTDGAQQAVHGTLVRQDGGGQVLRVPELNGVKH